MIYVIERWSVDEGWDFDYCVREDFESEYQAEEFCNSMDELDPVYDYFYTPLGEWENAQKLASPEVCKEVNEIISKDVVKSFAEVLKLKFTSGNDIPVDSVRLSYEEAKAFLNWNEHV